MDILEFLEQDQKKDLLRLLTAGSVDDGKSTLIGRLIFDSKQLYEDHLDALQRDSKRVGHAGDEIDYALLLDGLKAEREQGITIDVAYRYFSTNKRKFIIADTPGHEQYTRNMVTGASTANLAILLIDAKNGITTQTKRHSFIVSQLGIKHLFMAINKMDLVDYRQERFDEICAEYKQFLTRLKIPDVHFIPISALKGDNVVDRSKNMDWYTGEPLLEKLETIHVSSDRDFVDLRYPVQYVVRPSHTFRGFSAQVASGVIRKGEEVMALPSGKTSRVKSIITASGEKEYAFPPQSVTVTLEDEIDISRGDMIVHPNNQPHKSRRIEAMLVWMDEKPMDPNGQFFIKQTTQMTRVRFDKLHYKIDVNTLHRHDVDRFELNEIGRVVLTTARPLFFDPYEKNRTTGSFVIIDAITNNTSAVGMILDRHSSNGETGVIYKSQDREARTDIEARERLERLRQKPATLWFTGLHGSGKTHISYAVERYLFDQGFTAVVLDGDSVRSGLNKELGYIKADRDEHLRRVAEMAKLLNDQGIITICNFVSPDEKNRQMLCEIIGDERFNLVHVDADLEFCKQNDKKGLYAKAEEGALADVPGIDVTYEKPAKANYRLNIKDFEDLNHLSELYRFIETKITL